MSKIFIMCSLLLLSALPLSSQARDFWRPERPDRPERPVPGRPPAPSISFQTLESIRVLKFIEMTSTIRVNHPNVKVVQFKAIDNSIEIVEARLLLENGREVFMDGATGGLGRDRVVNFTLDGPWGERVRSITVRALTKNIIGSRGTLEVSVGVLQ